MDSFDIIVYGSDLSTLVIATYLVKKKKKVLYVDSNKRVGDYINSFHLRRFNIEDELDTLVMNTSKLKALFKDLNIDINFTSSNELYHVVTYNRNNKTKKEYVLPKGINEFINKIEEYVPGSKDGVTSLFELGKECKEAKEYLYNNINYEYKAVKDKYPNFIKVMGSSVSEVFDELGIPIAAQEILNVCWFYFSASETVNSFVDYIMFLYDLVIYNNQIPNMKYEEISAKLLKEYLDNKGMYFSNTRIDKIITVNKKVNGISIDNKIYYTKRLVTSLCPDVIYNELINNDEIPSNALKLNSKRILGGKMFTVYLGLNRSKKELDFESDKYFIYDSLDSDVQYKKMSSINNDSSLVIIKDNEVEGTSYMVFKTMFFNNAFEKFIDIDNYNNSIEDIANNIITSFEESTGKRIRDYIEEIKIYTPVDYEIKYNDSNHFGYVIRPMDNTIIRDLCKNQENYIKGIYICGKYGVCGGIDSNILEHAINLGKSL